MKRTPLAIVIGLAVLVAGCGSSNSSHSKSASTSSVQSVTSQVRAPTTSPKYVAPSRSAPLMHGKVQIAYQNIAITPDAVRVKLGSTITWTNYDPVEHNVVSAKRSPIKFASANFGEGQSFTIKVTKPGLIHYQCTIHPSTMNGSIEVVR
jgi:plastocyanin